MKNLFDESRWSSLARSVMHDPTKARLLPIGRGKIFSVFRGLESDLGDYTLALSEPGGLQAVNAQWWVAEMMVLAQSGLPLIPPMHAWWDEALQMILWVKPWLPDSLGLHKQWPDVWKEAGLQLEDGLRARGLVQTDYWDLRRLSKQAPPYVVDWSDLAKMGAAPPLVQSR